MQALNTWKQRIIIGSLMLGGIHGLVAAIGFNAGSIVPPWDIVVSVVSGAVLSATVATAVCRVFEAWQIIRESRNWPEDHSQCYRGVRMSPQDPNSESDRNCRKHRVDDSLSFRGVHVQSPVSGSEPDCESPNRPTKDGLCYRGIHHTGCRDVSRV